MSRFKLQSVQDPLVLVRDAKVEVKPIVRHTRQGHLITQAEILVNDQFAHRFPSTSRVSKHLSMMNAEELGARLSGGTYMFVGDELVDFRDGSYAGFIHTDKSIESLVDTIGITSIAAHPLHSRGLASRESKGEDDAVKTVALRNIWDAADINLPEFGQGGAYKALISFVWSPFVTTVNSRFDLIRIICANGMVGVSPLFNMKVPLLNRWEQHLDIASQQLRFRVEETISENVRAMGTRRASVADAARIVGHLRERAPSGGQRLSDLIDAVDPIRNLQSVYKPEVFSSQRLSKFLPSHITALDAHNIITELRTHYASSGTSTDAGLDRFANQLMFNEESTVTTLASPQISAMSDPEQAFFIGCTA